MDALQATPTMDALRAQMETELRDIVGSREMDLYRMMSYHLGWEHDDGSPRDSGDARRTHGVACLTACHAVGGDLDMALPAAASVELAKNSKAVAQAQGKLDATKPTLRRTTEFFESGKKLAHHPVCGQFRVTTGRHLLKEVGT